MAPKFLPVKGTRDFYPEEMAVRAWLFGAMRETSRLFGYAEYDGPFLEPMELYAAKSGEELVKEQTFLLTDRGGRQLALRPELTPSLARLVAQKQQGLLKPLRWFSIGPMWRYEQPQKGRTREFFQWNVDLLGPESARADAELIAIGAEFFRKVGLSPKEVQIRVNDRRYVERELLSLGIGEDRKGAAFRAIDRKDKMRADLWRESCAAAGLSSAETTGIEELLSRGDGAESSPELGSLLAALADLGVADYARVDHGIVRGLDYYTGTVFEARDPESKFRAILGGGRYDNLVEVVGGERLSGVGFAAGDVVIEILLRELGKIPDVAVFPARALVTVFDEASFAASARAATALRAAGVPAELFLGTARLDKQIQYAQKKRIPFVVVIGPEEAAKGLVTVKRLSTQDQRSVALSALPDAMREDG